MDKIALEANVLAAKIALEAAVKALTDFLSSPENNVFSSLKEAEGALEDALLDQAQKDCEGSYNCGADVYTQEFIVDGKHYLAKLECEYNRHDKTYYYVDGYEFTTSPIEAA